MIWVFSSEIWERNTFSCIEAFDEPISCTYLKYLHEAVEVALPCIDKRNWEKFLLRSKITFLRRWAPECAAFWRWALECAAFWRWALECATVGSWALEGAAVGSCVVQRCLHFEDGAARWGETDRNLRRWYVRSMDESVKQWRHLLLKPCSCWLEM